MSRLPSGVDEREKKSCGHPEDLLIYRPQPDLKIRDTGQPIPRLALAAENLSNIGDRNYSLIRRVFKFKGETEMKSAAKTLWICLLVLGLSFTPTTSASSQTYTATVTGTVSDAQGAAVPKVKVVATNQGTKLEYTAQTSDSGVYTIPFLPVGVYVLTVEASGFKKLVSNEITLEVTQTARVDLQLQVGGVNEIVNVQGVAPVLQTENVMVGQVISGTTTAALPLTGRNFQQLTLLVPGTINPNPGGFNSVGQGAQGRPYVNGNREQGNAFLLDGISVDETIDNRIGYKPNVDAIAEFRVETSNSSAEFGNVTGATVNATLKSGTNDFHGNLFEFLRNDKFDAQPWGNNRTMALNPLTKIAKAPAEWRTGNLSSLGVNIRDPQTCTNPRDVSTCKFFSGGMIPAERIVNPVAKALFANPSLYPLPASINPGNKTGVLPVVTAGKVDSHQFDIKLDARLSEKDNVSGRYSFTNYDQVNYKGSIPLIPTGGAQ